MEKKMEATLHGKCLITISNSQRNRGSGKINKLPMIIFTSDQPGFEPTPSVVLLISNNWLSEEKIKHWVAVFAYFCAVKTPSVADFK